MPLTPKETSLLKDLTDTEQLCVQKYTDYASRAHDPQLKNLFSEIAAIERGHLQILQDMQSGKNPSAPSGSVTPPTFSAVYTAGESAEKKDDAYFCADLLATEKHASHLYDTCVFEFTTAEARDTLNGIQKSEQGHGKMLYDYMAQNAMYG